MGTTVRAIKTVSEMCRGCRFNDIADSLDSVCIFKPNFEAAPRKRLLKLSDVSDKDVKRKDDKVLAIFLPEAVVDRDKKPEWCRLIHTTISYTEDI